MPRSAANVYTGVVGDQNLTCSFLGSFLLLHQLGLLKDSLNLLKALKVIDVIPIG